jgi:hypothetical protein
MEVKLIVVGGDAKTTEIDLKLPTVIGRGRGATLTLPHPLVSRQHCEIYETEGQLYVRDLGSLNGTFIGNEPISEAVLPPGELLTVGAVTFRAIYGELLDRERRDRESPAGPRRSSPSTRTVRGEAVETVAPPHVRTVKDPSSNAKPAPPSSASAADLDEVIDVEEEAELVEFHEGFDAGDDLLVVEVEEVIESSLSSASLFTGAVEESPEVIDDALPEGSTFDSAKPVLYDDTSESLPKPAPAGELDEVEVVDEEASSDPDLLPVTAPPTGKAPPRNGASSPSSNVPRGVEGRQPPEDDDELQTFLRHLK